MIAKEWEILFTEDRSLRRGSGILSRQLQKDKNKHARVDKKKERAPSNRQALRASLGAQSLDHHTPVFALVSRPGLSVGGQAWPACPTRRWGSPHCPASGCPPGLLWLCCPAQGGHQSSCAKLTAGHPGEEWVLSLGCCDHPGLRKTSELLVGCALLSSLHQQRPLVMAPSSAVFFL